MKETPAIEPATKPPTKSVAKAPAKAAAEPAAEPAAKPATRSAAKPATKPATKAATKAAAKPATKAAAKPAAGAAAKPAVKAATPPAAGSRAKATADPAAERAAPSAGLPKRPRPARKAGAKSPLDMARRIVALAEDKKAADILLLDLAGLTTVADAFVICSGGSERQLESIADGIIRGMREDGIRPIGREGLPASHWILVDFGDVIVHVFTPPERDYYGLEKHWSEAKAILRVQ